MSTSLVNSKTSIRSFVVVLVLWSAGLSGSNWVSGQEADYPPPLSPQQSVKKFKVADGLSISLVAAEPLVSQPVSLSFDDRGRLWVLQYLQYPNPNGLTPVQMDNWLRTKYDKMPAPPPQGPKGRDRISVYSDSNGDGVADDVKHFVSDLNLASGMALGYDGVFVVQPPYLLYYADLDRDDQPDGPPEVLVTGFGMEDAHAFANSLTWGPDGWLYGAQGSTATANIRGIEFQQGVWRYHPRTRQFELFAEGGGNSWGVEFDQFGNLFAAGNTVEPLVHHVQGAYYVKGFGKHGPLHNPHAYGYFQPVLHHGYVGDSLTGGAILYQGGAFPSQFNNACIAPNTRHSACRWSTVELRGSSFATRAAGDFVTSEDIWFRPVDMTVGPDGAVYIADWYDHTISHSSPKNRSEWYQPNRHDGRVWRVAPPDLDLVQPDSFDLSRLSSDELVRLLSHRNDWYARGARRLLAERRDRSVIPALRELALKSQDQRLALQGLWSLSVIGGLDDDLTLQLLNSPHEYVRAWTVRLTCDDQAVTSSFASALVRLADQDPSVVVRSQLACSAKRLPARDAIPIVDRLLARDSDTADVHVPLLLWWAIEHKCVSDTTEVLKLVSEPGHWQRPLMQQFIVERMARRFAAEKTDAGYAICVQLLKLAPGNDDLDRVLTGMLRALSGQKLEQTPAPLVDALRQLSLQHPNHPKAIELGLRLGERDVEAAAIRMVQSSQAGIEPRASMVQTLGQTRVPMAIGPLLGLLDEGTNESLQSAALSALGYFGDEQIASKVLKSYPKLSSMAKGRAVEVLCSRPAWGVELLSSVDAGTVPTQALSLDQLRQLRDHNDPKMNRLISKHWGQIQTTTPLELDGRIGAVLQILGRGKGDPLRGRAHFQKACASCHKLHGHGNEIGPDLTGAERRNRELLVRNTVDPSSVIREQFLMYIATLHDGRVVSGLLAESTDNTVTLLDAKNKRTVIVRTDLDTLVPGKTSLMPEKILDELSNQELRDLFAYVQSDQDVAP